MQNVVKDFEMIRSTLRRLFVQGRYVPGTSRSEKSRLQILQTVFGPLLQKEGEGWRLDYDPFQQDTNYLFRAYTLCALHNKANVVRPALLLQTLARCGRALTSDECTTQLSKCFSGVVDERPVKATLRQMVRDGRLQETRRGRYALAPGLPAAPEGVSPGDWAEQWSLLTVLIPLLADRQLPQSWGYRTRDSLCRELKRLGWYVPPARAHITQKKHARFQMMLDDEVLWKLADAHCQGQPVQLEYQPAAMEQRFFSEPLQPLWTVSRLAEGRVILVARALSGKDAPVVLPLEEITGVWALPCPEPQSRTAAAWLPDEQREEWRQRWFTPGPAPCYPLPAAPDGTPCPPVLMQALFAPSADESAEQLARRLPLPRQGGKEVREDGVFWWTLAARPEDWEPLLFRFEKNLKSLQTTDPAFEADFAALRRQWAELGAAPLAPPFAWRYPAPVPHRLGGSAAAMVELFDPYQNQAVQKGLDWIAQAAAAAKGRLTYDPRTCTGDLRDLLEGGELGNLGETKEADASKRGFFIPHMALAVPAPLTWPEKEWLRDLLNSPAAAALLDPVFCGRVRDWLEQSLAQAVQSGLYRLHMTPDFMILDAYRNSFGPQPGALAPAALALYRNVGLQWTNRPGRPAEPSAEPVERPGMGIPTRIEYEIARDRLYLMAVPLLEAEGEGLRQIRMQAGRLRELAALPTLPGTPDQQREAFGWLKKKKDRENCQALVGLWRGSEERACARLRAYTMTTHPTPGGSLRICLQYLPFERFDVLADLQSLLPAVWLEKDGTDPELLKLFKGSQEK